MGQRAKTKVEIRDFPGLQVNVDPEDIPPGASQKQVNACSISIAELQVRAGYREVVFENE